MLKGEDGFHRLQALVVLLFAVTMLVLATAVAPRFAHGFQHTRITKAQGDVNAITQAVQMYTIRKGSLPPSLGVLTAADTNERGELVGPFLPQIPVPPGGGRPPWAISYTYVVKDNGTFAVYAAGDNAFVSYP